jgi:cytochrome bd-type quinol oxidase subunit 2
MRHRPAIAGGLLLGALVLGGVAQTFDHGDSTGTQWWVRVLGYVVLVLLALFAVVVLTGLVGLVRRTFQDAHRGSVR